MSMAGSLGWTAEQKNRFHEVMETTSLENLTEEQAHYILTGEVDTTYRDLDTELRMLQISEAEAATRLKGVI